MSETSEDKPATSGSIGTIEVKGMSLRRFIEWFNAVPWNEQDDIRVDMKMTHRQNMTPTSRNKFDTGVRRGAHQYGRKAFRDAKALVGTGGTFTKNNPFVGHALERFFDEGWEAERLGGKKENEHEAK